MKHHLITGACLVGAIGCYWAGIDKGAVAFAMGGLLLEAFFWIRLFRKRPASTP